MALAALLLTGCQASPRVNVHIFQDGYGVYRCANGQSVVGESADLDNNGNIPYGAGTEVRKDGYYANEEPQLSPFWNAINSSSELQVYKPNSQGSYTWQLCDFSPPTSSTSGRTTFTADADWCGNYYYEVIGRHRSVRYDNATFVVLSFTGSTYVAR